MKKYSFIIFGVALGAGTWVLDELLRVESVVVYSILGLFIGSFQTYFSRKD